MGDLLVVHAQLGAPDHRRERRLFGIDDLEEFDSSSHCEKKELGQEIWCGREVVWMGVKERKWES